MTWLLAVLTSVIWGFAFVAVKFALESFSAPQLTAVRFLIAGGPARLPRASILDLVAVDRADRDDLVQRGRQAVLTGSGEIIRYGRKGVGDHEP